jgi:hypothetical protein
MTTQFSVSKPKFVVIMEEGMNEALTESALDDGM